MKTLAAALLMLAVMSANAPQVRAGIQVGDIVMLANGVGHPGGVFNVDNLTDVTEPNFDTFCAELQENIFFGLQYQVFGIGTVSVTGGKSLTPFAAWLYDRFLGHGGGLPSFNPLDPLDTNTVQFGIWKSLGYTQTEIDAATFANFFSTYNTRLTNKGWLGTFNTQVANSQWSGIGSVRIMNLRTLPDQLGRVFNGQDQLCRVPEPLSVIIWPVIVACFGCGWTYHKRRQGR